MCSLNLSFESMVISKSFSLSDIFMVSLLISMHKSWPSFSPKNISWDVSVFATIYLSLYKFVTCLMSFSILMDTSGKVSPHA